MENLECNISYLKFFFIGSDCFIHVEMLIKSAYVLYRYVESIWKKDRSHYDGRIILDFSTGTGFLGIAVEILTQKSLQAVYFCDIEAQQRLVLQNVADNLHPLNEADEKKYVFFAHSWG